MDKKAVEDKLKDILTDYLRLDQGEINDDSDIVNDLGADSLALVELGFKFSDEFSIPMLPPDDSLFIFSELVKHVVKEMEVPAV